MDMVHDPNGSGNTYPTDCREQLYNSGATGSVTEIQLPTEQITSLRGVMLDIDPKHYRISPLLPVVPLDPVAFYLAVLKVWLNRHPTLAKAEVRMSGTGLHAILWFAEPIVFNTAGDRERWAGIVQVLQAALPTDPDAPGLTSLTRPVGAANSKNGARIEQLEPGAPVSEQEVLELFDAMCTAPFRTVLTILAGADRISPCPFCGSVGSTLSALDHIGKCYGNCGSISLQRLYELVLLDRDPEEGCHADFS